MREQCLAGLDRKRSHLVLEVGDLHNHRLLALIGLADLAHGLPNLVLVLCLDPSREAGTGWGTSGSVSLGLRTTNRACVGGAGERETEKEREREREKERERKRERGG